MTYYEGVVTQILREGKTMTDGSCPAWAVISPAGELAWYPLAATREVEALVSGERAPGALDTATVTLRGILPGRGPLKVLASDVALLFGEDYPLNPVAQRVLTALSGGRISQPWRGHVALAEYERDQVSGEVLWPGDMCPEWAEAIKTAVRRGQDCLLREVGGVRGWCGTRRWPFRRRAGRTSSR